MKRLPLVQSPMLGGRVLQHWRLRQRDDFADLVKAKLFVTKRCNLNCVHCGIGEAAFDGSTDLSTEQVLRIWQENPELQIVSLSGGEPFLRDDLIEIGVGAVESLPNLMVLTVNTNGYFTEKVVAFAEAVGSRMPRGTRLIITCSSDGPEPTHGTIRRDPESYARKERTVTALLELKKRVPRLRVKHNVNVNRWNIETVADYIEEKEKRGEPCFVSLYSASRHYSHKKKHFQELEAFRAEIAQRTLLRRLRRTKSGLFPRRFLALAEGFYEEGERKQPLPCFSLRASVIIEADGMVRPCINFPVDLGKVQDFGFRLRDVVRTEKSNKTRELIRCEKCPVCWTPNEAFVTMMCNLPNPKLWKP